MLTVMFVRFWASQRAVDLSYVPSYLTPAVGAGRSSHGDDPGTSPNISSTSAIGLPHLHICVRRQPPPWG